MRSRFVNIATFVIVAATVLAFVAVANHVRSIAHSVPDQGSVGSTSVLPPSVDHQSTTESTNDDPIETSTGEATTSNGPPQPSPETRSLNEIWVEFCTVSVPELERIYQDLGKQSELQAEQRLAAMIRNAKNSRFVDHIQSFQSSFDSVFAKDQHIQWIKSTFEKDVFSERDIELVLSSQLKQLHTALSDCDDQLLIKLGIDATYDGRSILTPNAKINALAPKLSSVVSRVQNKVVDVAVESLISTVSGAAAGELTYSLTNGALAYDADGNYNLAGDLFSYALAMGASVVAEAATESAIDAKGSLRRTVNEGMDEMASVLLSKDTSIASWRKSMRDLSAAHLAGVLDCVVTDLGLDKDFANAELAKVRTPQQGVSR